MKKFSIWKKVLVSCAVLVGCFSIQLNHQNQMDSESFVSSSFLPTAHANANEAYAFYSSGYIPQEVLSNHVGSMNMESTAYSPDEPGGGGYHTATGDVVQYGVIAVDPSIIPLYTKVFVEGYGYATALDTGGAIHGNIIDVAFNDMSNLSSWGRRYIDVYILG